MPEGIPAASFGFNSFQEIKSHSSILSNERLAILFYLLDMRAIQMNTSYDINSMMETKAILKQVYKNIRTLLRNNPTCRATLNLETKDKGIYTTDIAMHMLDRMVEYCSQNGFTRKKLYVIIQEINNLEMEIKDVLQYFHYMFRPDFRQKPDILVATQKYREIADERTVEELRAIVGKNHKIEWENLGMHRIELNEPLPELDIETSTNDVETENMPKNEKESEAEALEWEGEQEGEELGIYEEGSNSASDGNYDSTKGDDE